MELAKHRLGTSAAGPRGSGKPYADAASEVAKTTADPALAGATEKALPMPDATAGTPYQHRLANALERLGTAVASANSAGTPPLLPSASTTASSDIATAPDAPSPRRTASLRAASFGWGAIASLTAHGSLVAQVVYLETVALKGLLASAGCAAASEQRRVLRWLLAQRIPAHGARS